MSEHSSRKPRPRKAAERPKKPYPDFPLTPHAGGSWMKKIRGKIHYFGRWARREGGKLVRIPGDGWEDALKEYKKVADDLHAGRTPRVKSEGGLNVGHLCNRFLTAKLRKREAGELGPRSFLEYKQTTDLLVSAFGKTRLVADLAADDFEKLRADMAKRWGPVRLGNAITRVKTVFKYADDNTLIDRPVRFGSEFTKPDKAVLRRHKAQNGERMLEAAEVRKLIDTADVPYKAAILLGINCGFGNTDLAALPRPALDLDRGWLDFPRPKTGIPRRCPLWPETVAALRETLAARPAPKDKADSDLVFLNAQGGRLVYVREKVHTDEATGQQVRKTNWTDNVSIQVAKLLKRLELHRSGIGFYTLRHVFRTIADAARDTVAVDHVMGHSDPTMAAHYCERIDDSRLRAVADHVHAWLFGTVSDRQGP